VLENPGLRVALAVQQFHDQRQHRVRAALLTAEITWLTWLTGLVADLANGVLAWDFAMIEKTLERYG
jgi:hypothetical protein